MAMSDERLLAFTRALADAARGGLPWAETLRGLKLARAAESVSRGEPLHASLGALGRYPPIFIALLRAGEESGKIDAFLERYASALEVRIDFRRKLKRALAYPAFAAGLAGGILLLFLTKAAPMLLAPLMEAGVKAPPETALAISYGNLLLERWPAVLGAVFFSVLAARALAGSFLGRGARALAGHWLPGVRYAVEESRYHEFEATLELLLGAGLRPKQIMEILGEQFRDDPLLRSRLSRGAAMLAEGKDFSESLAACLPEEDRDRVSVAEKAGRLDEALGKLALGHRDKQLHRLKVTANALQLTATVALAPVCFVIILGLLWPSISMMRQSSAQLMGGAALPAAEGPSGAGGLRNKSLAGPPKASGSSSFNEENAKKVVSFMQSRKAPSGRTGGEVEGKPAAPKLKAPASMRKAPFKKIEPSPIKSSFD